MKKILTVIFSSFLLVSVAFAQAAPVGSLSYLEGRVDRQRAGETAFTPMIQGEDVVQGDVLRTKSFSRAEVRFADGSLLKLGENTKINIRDYALKNNRRMNGDIFIERGKVRAIVEKSATGQNNFFLNTPNSRGAVKGSIIGVGYERATTSFLVMEGQIAAQNIAQPGKEVVIEPGYTSIVPGQEAPQKPRAALDIEKTRFESDTEAAARSGKTKEVGISKALISKYSGDVRVKSAKAPTWHRAAYREVLSAGDTIQTGENGRVKIVLESGRVVNLKPFSDLTIEKLSRDEKTGKREDKLFLKSGKLRAAIRKGIDETTFQVSSPTAIASVRGTILYFFVSPQKSQAFFQDGHGSLASLLKALQTALNNGQSAWVDAEGDLHGPANTGSNELGIDWDPEEEDYGYSEPERGIPGTEPIQDTPNNDLFNLNNVDLNKFFDDGLPPVTDGEEPPSSEPFGYGTWGSERRRDGSLYSNNPDNPGTFYHVGEESGVISGQVIPWNSPQPYTVAGEFTDWSGCDTPLLFNTPFFSGDDETNVTPDNGAFFGRGAGFWANNTIEGTTAAIFRDPSGNLGLWTGGINGIYGDVFGENDSVDHLWLAVGGFTPQVLGHTEIPAEFFEEFIESGEISGNIVGNLDNQGWFQGGLDEESRIQFFYDTENRDASEHFGIYSMRFGNNNTFSNPYGIGTWAGAAGGSGDFGRFQTFGEGNSLVECYYEQQRDDFGYWISALSGTWGSEGQIVSEGNVGQIRGQVDNGGFLSYTQLGFFSGALTGYSDSNSSSWIGQSVGTFVSNPLSFFSLVETDFVGTDFCSNGFINAHFGGVDSLWDNELAQVFVLGEFEAGNQALWNTSLVSNNMINDTQTTYNGGAYFGHFAGLKVGDGMVGNFVGLYADSDGRAGLLNGDLGGGALDSLGLFFMGGFLSHQELSGGEDSPYYSPEYFDSYIQSGESSGQFRGSFASSEGPEGRLKGELDFLTNYLDNPENYYQETWGIYNLTIDKWDDGVFFNPDNSELWTAVMGGDDAEFGHYYGDNESDGADRGIWYMNAEGLWVNGALQGTTSGHYMTHTQFGTLSGDLTGLYDESYFSSHFNFSFGEWIGQSIGTYSGESLDYAGRVTQFGDEIDSTFLSFNGRRFGSMDSEIGGLLGGFGDLWNGDPSPVHLIGDYFFDCGREPKDAMLWNFELSSYNVYQDNNTTFDNGAFYGFSMGAVNENSMTGFSRFIYVSPLTDGEGYDYQYRVIGILRGNLDGTLLPLSSDSGLYALDGTLIADPRGHVYLENPDDLFSHITENGIYSPNTATGSFENEESEIRMTRFKGVSDEFAGQEWGIWGAVMGGEYCEPGTDFSIAFGGEIEGSSGYNEYNQTNAINVQTNYEKPFIVVFDGSRSENGEINGHVQGVWVSDTGIEDNFIAVGRITGDVTGNESIEADQWQAVVTGEWDKMAELDPEQVGFDTEGFQNFIAEPITQTYSNIIDMTGGFAGNTGSIAASMNTGFFSQVGAGNFEGIWTGLIQGSFSGMPEGGSNLEWNASFFGILEGFGNVNVLLEGTDWVDGQWLANVSIFGENQTESINQDPLASGQAGGTYVFDGGSQTAGTFEGVGIGEWQNTPPNLEVILNTETVTPLEPEILPEITSGQDIVLPDPIIPPSE